MFKERKKQQTVSPNRIPHNMMTAGALQLGQKDSRIHVKVNAQ